MAALPVDAMAVEEKPLADGAVADNPLADSLVKHAFLHLSLDPDWIYSPLNIDTNTSLMVSVNGGDWHGTTQIRPQ